MAEARFSKVSVTFLVRDQYWNLNLKNEKAGFPQQTSPFCFVNW